MGSDNLLVADFECFYTRTVHRMTARAIMICGNRQDAEDAVQDAYFQVHQRWDVVRDYDSPEARVHLVMVQRLGKMHRWRVRQRKRIEALPAAVHADLEQTVEVREIFRLLPALPPKQRKALIMSYQGMSQADIAKAMGVTRGTVARNIYKARRSLEKTLGWAAAKDRSPQDEFVPVSGTGLPRASMEHDPLAGALLDTETLIQQAIEAEKDVRERIRSRISGSQQDGP
jgi:RNA polymerase sigma-70 factor (ECF subfamily)